MAEHLEPRTVLSAGTASVSGLAFIDADGDTINDNNEVVVRGIVVQLTRTSAGDPVTAEATTDVNGEFTFIRVPAGTYTLTALPGAQLTGSPTVVTGVVVTSGEVNQNLALGGLKPTLLSLRQFLNTSTTETIPFATAGDGRDAASNDAPTVLAAANLDITTAQTSAASPTPTNVDLAGIFTDANFDNSEVRFRTSAGNINVELFDKDTPITVANFYEYANSGRYNDTIFHRLVDDFVLQGGGFKFDDASNTFPSVSTDPTIKNEPDTVNRSNLANTIAMAKLGGDPNSASSQFFFNLADNRGTSPNGLDFQNGSFTVFGKIAGTTPSPTTAVTNSVLLDLADTAISNRSSTNSAFGELPLNNYTGTNFPTDASPNNFLRILGIDTVRRDEFLTYSLLVDGSPVSTIDNSLMTATIVNHRLRVTPKTNQAGQANIIVRATDEFGDSVTATFRVHIVPAGNSAPLATVNMSPAQPLVNSTLTATATKSDANSNPVTLTYVWKNGSTVLKTTSGSSSLTDTLDLTTVSGQVSAGDTISVEVTPNDGFVDGLKVTSQRVIDNANTAPTATASLAPDNPVADSTLTATATTSDANGQSVSLNYVWKVGTTPVKTTSGTTSLTDTLDLSTVSGADKGATVTVEITPNDSVENGVTVSDSVVIANSAPTASVVLSPTSPASTAVLTASATAADIDSDIVSLTYVWKVGSTVVKTTSGTTSLTDMLDILAETTATSGDTITVEVTPNDGTINGSMVSDSVTIV